MSSNSMCMQIEGVNLKVKPIECEGLDQAQYRFAKEAVDPTAKSSSVLIQKRHNGVTEN